MFGLRTFFSGTILSPKQGLGLMSLAPCFYTPSVCVGLRPIQCGKRSVTPTQNVDSFIIFVIFCGMLQ